MNVECWVKNTQGEKADKNEQQVPDRNPNDAFLSVELNSENAQKWCFR